MAPSAHSIWDHAADKDLLLTIIDEGGPGAAKWAFIAGKMQSKGYTFTKEACRQHFQKIRKEGRNGGAPSPQFHNGPSPRATKNTASAKSTPRKGKAMIDSFPTTNGFSDEDDDEDMSTPAKRKRTVKYEEDGGQSAPLFKFEGQGTDEKPIDLERRELYIDADDENEYV